MSELDTSWQRGKCISHVWSFHSLSSTTRGFHRHHNDRANVNGVIWYLRRNQCDSPCPILRVVLMTIPGCTITACHRGDIAHRSKSKPREQETGLNLKSCSRGQLIYRLSSFTEYTVQRWWDTSEQGITLCAGRRAGKGEGGHLWLIIRGFGSQTR